MRWLSEVTRDADRFARIAPCLRGGSGELGRCRCQRLIGEYRTPQGRLAGHRQCALLDGAQVRHERADLGSTCLGGLFVRLCGRLIGQRVPLPSDRRRVVLALQWARISIGDGVTMVACGLPGCGSHRS